ncbi:hypothetical protein ACA910_011135 [Epithemia clementina (nom. ined.)]
MAKVPGVITVKAMEHKPTKSMTQKIMKTGCIPKYLLLIIFSLLMLSHVPALFWYLDRPCIFQMLVNPLAYYNRKPKIVSIIGEPSITSYGFWKNDYNVVHVIHTRFMQNQATLHHLAKARLELFQTFALPSIEH